MGPTTFLGLCLLGCLGLRPSLQGSQEHKCPQDWLHFGGHCYGYFGLELSWGRAEDWCRATRGGGHLASVHTPAEHRAVAAFIAQHRRGEEEEVWIGLYLRAQIRAWTWVDGSPKRYSAWDGDDASRGKRCAALEDSSGFLAWEDDPCSERKPFVCKYRV